ncbi:MAG: carbohydrate kinase family protein [Aestuariivirga sp.]
MNPRPRIAVFGSVHMDLIAHAQTLPEKARSGMAQGFSMGLGGKGGNQAVECVAMGAEAFMVTRLGDDEFGRSLLSSLQARGVDCSGIEVAEYQQTGASTVLSAPEGYTSLIFPGAAAAMSVEDIEARIMDLMPLDMLLLQLELPVALSVAAARIARANATTVVLNASPPAGNIDALLACTDFLVVNEAEAIALIGEADAMKLAKEIGGRAVMTCGAKGSVGSDGSEVYEQHAVRVEVNSTVGAGDAFLAGLCVELCRSNDLKAALEAASQSAARKLSLT